MAKKGQGIVVKFRPLPAAVAGPCAHRWLIETPSGPTVEGVCRVCNETRVFPTVIHDFEPLGREGYFGRKEQAARARGEW